MIKTKSILAKKSNDDGTRICIMRWVKSFYDYNEWLRDLAPSSLLLMEYRNNHIDWKLFELGYKREMILNNVKGIIKQLRERSDSGEIIILLCWEKSDVKCHRRLLKELIES